MATTVAAGDLFFNQPGGDCFSAFGGISFQDNLSADPRSVDADAGDYTLERAIEATVARDRLPSDFSEARGSRGRRANVRAIKLR